MDELVAAMAWFGFGAYMGTIIQVWRAKKLQDEADRLLAEAKQKTTETELHLAEINRKVEAMKEFSALWSYGARQEALDTLEAARVPYVIRKG